MFFRNLFASSLDHHLANDVASYARRDHGDGAVAYLRQQVAKSDTSKIQRRIFWLAIGKARRAALA